MKYILVLLLVLPGCGLFGFSTEKSREYEAKKQVYEYWVHCLKVTCKAMCEKEGYLTGTVDTYGISRELKIVKCKCYGRNYPTYFYNKFSEMDCGPEVPNP